MTAQYQGLPRATPDYLAALAAHNDRDWFEARRDRYAQDWLAAGLDLAAALSGPCAGLTPPLLAVPKLNASLRRIHRDVRFSPDKRPYDPRLHLILSTGPAFNKVPGVHIVIGADGLGYGAGHYGFTPPMLERFRHRLCEPGARAGLEALLAQAAQVGCLLDPPDLTRVPRGFDAAPDWDHLIRRKCVILRTPAPLPLPAWLFTPDCVDGLMRIVRALNPLAHWLTEFAA